MQMCTEFVFQTTADVQGVLHFQSEQMSHSASIRWRHVSNRSFQSNYAVPLFIRTVSDMGNMKHLKHQFQDEGADPAKVPGDRVLWMNEQRRIRKFQA
jgi:hypothetical protein